MWYGQVVIILNKIGSKLVEIPLNYWKKKNVGYNKYNLFAQD